MKNNDGTLFNKLRRRLHGKKSAASASEATPPETLPVDLTIDPSVVIEWRQAKLLKGKVVIPSGMTELRDRLFQGNKEITSVIIPGTVKHIRELAFSGCESLEEVVLNEGIEGIGNNVFQGTRLRTVTYPDSVSETTGWAFHRLEMDAPVMNVSGTRLVCVSENLAGKSYAVPEGTEVIGPHAFNLQAGLAEVRFPDSLRRIEDWAFTNCGLREIVIPTSVKYVGSNAFHNCEALERVTILNPRAAVRPGAFSGCRLLKEIQWAGNRTAVDYCHLLGAPFMGVVGRAPAANLPHTGKARFKRLSRLCAEGRADSMEALAEWFEAWSQKPDASQFYRLAANFWHFRAYAKRQPQAVEWMEAWMEEHPNERLPSLLHEDIYTRTGVVAGSANGQMLNDLGFSLFDPERSYSLQSIPGKGVIEVKSYESEDGPDEDGFGREDYYDRWYLDENLQPIPGIKMMHSYSFLDKRNAAREFDALIDEASQIAHAQAIQRGTGRGEGWRLFRHPGI